MESFFELIKFTFFLIKIFDQSSSSLLHLVKSSLKSFNYTGHGSFHLSSVLRMPDVVSDELFNGFLPGVLKVLLFTHEFELVHKSIDVFDKDIISGNQNLLLLLFLTTGRLLVAGLLCRLRIWLKASIATAQWSSLRAFPVSEVLVWLLTVSLMSSVLDPK